MEEVIEEKKKSKKGIVFLVIVLVLIILGLVGYIAYDKGIIDLGQKEGNNNINVEKTSNKEQELDVDSRLVQNLYKSVTTGSEPCDKNWIYGSENSEFNVKTAKEEVKMNVMEEITNVDVEKNIYHILHYIPILKLSMMAKHQKVQMLIKSRMGRGEVDPVKIF